LLVGLKNAGDLVGDLVTSFDFSVVEQCGEYDECAVYAPFPTANKPVFGIEYSDKAENCKRENAAGTGFNGLFKDMSLNGPAYNCRTSKQIV